LTSATPVGHVEGREEAFVRLVCGFLVFSQRAEGSSACDSFLLERETKDTIYFGRFLSREIDLSQIPPLLERLSAGAADGLKRSGDLWRRTERNAHCWIPVFFSIMVRDQDGGGSK
jgi:hypothetical protein